MENPIKNNRIVEDKTFALRMLSFFLELPCQGDAASEEEKESMISYSSKLLKYQMKTAEDIEEINYLERCGANGLLCKSKNFLK